MLRGVTTSAEAKNVLLKELARKGYAVMDWFELLPDVKGLEGKTYGYYQCVCGKYACRPGFLIEMMTQSLMGCQCAYCSAMAGVRIRLPTIISPGVASCRCTSGDRRRNGRVEQGGKDRCDRSLRFCLFRTEPNFTNGFGRWAGNRLKWEGTKELSTR